MNIKKAKLYICRMYKRIFKIEPMISIVDDELHYNALSIWCYSNAATEEELYRLSILCRLVYKAMRRYPDVEEEICYNFYDLLPIEHHSTPEICWTAGYISGVLNGGSGSGFVFEEEDDECFADYEERAISSEQMKEILKAIKELDNDE